MKHEFTEMLAYTLYTFLICKTNLVAAKMARELCLFYAACWDDLLILWKAAKVKQAGPCIQWIKGFQGCRRNPSCLSEIVCAAHMLPRTDLQH